MVTYRDAMNVEHEMYDYNGNDWSHRNSNRRFKKLEALRIKYSVESRQQTAVLGTTHIIRNVLQWEA